MTKKIEKHFHCPDCGEILEEISRFSWTSIVGVVIIYKCSESVFVLEEKNKKLKKIYSYAKEN